MCLKIWSLVINLDLFWKQSFLLSDKEKRFITVGTWGTPSTPACCRPRWPCCSPPLELSGSVKKLWKLQLSQIRQHKGKIISHKQNPTRQHQAWLKARTLFTLSSRHQQRYTNTGSLYWRGRLSTVDPLVLTT